MILPISCLLGLLILCIIDHTILFFIGFAGTIACLIVADAQAFEKRRLEDWRRAGYSDSV